MGKAVYGTSRETASTETISSLKHYVLQYKLEIMEMHQCIFGKYLF